MRGRAAKIGRLVAFESDLAVYCPVICAPKSSLLLTPYTLAAACLLGMFS
jgi:hypothetical protein